MGQTRATAASGISAAADRQWTIVLALYIVGDSVTTAVSLHGLGLAEANPLVAALVATVGVWGLLVAKLAAVLGYYLLWRALPSPYAVGVPLALATLGAAATGWNLIVMAMAAS
jgi:hypothetical protein